MIKRKIKCEESNNEKGVRAGEGEADIKGERKREKKIKVRDIKHPV